MTREGSIERAKTAASLANSDRPYVHWQVPNIGRLSLKYRVLVPPAPPARIYELQHIEPAASDGLYPSQRFVFLEDGKLIGALKSELESDEDGRLINKEAARSAAEFQIASGLAIPDENDQTQLDELLASGVDNPTLSEVWDDE